MSQSLFAIGRSELNSHRLRCDRQSPCSACVRRDKATECVYSSSEQERKDAIDYRPHARGQGARDRVARLETLVTEMREKVESLHQPFVDTASPAKALNDHTPALDPADGRMIDEMGKLSLTDNHTVYTGSSHWISILEDVSYHPVEPIPSHLMNDVSSSNNLETSCMKSIRIAPQDSNRSHSMLDW